MYNLVDNFKKHAQKSFEEITAKSSLKYCKQGKNKLKFLTFLKVS